MPHQHDEVRARSRGRHLRRHAWHSSETSTVVSRADTNGPTCGRPRVTTIARTAANATCHRTRARTWRRAMNKIAFLNDGLRRTFARGKVMMTAGVAALPEDALTQVLERVRHFDEFTKENDPHGEHDFGSVELAGVSYFFKIDYYALDMTGGSEDPSDPEKTTRVLTIMRADEY